MPIMAASMHHALVLRAVRRVANLIDRQRIHVGAQQDGLAGQPASHQSDDARAADACLDLDPELPQTRLDQRGCPLLGVGELRPLVDGSPRRDDFVADCARRIEHLA